MRCTKAEVKAYWDLGEAEVARSLLRMIRVEKEVKGACNYLPSFIRRRQSIKPPPPLRPGAPTTATGGCGARTRRGS